MENVFYCHCELKVRTEFQYLSRF